MKTGCYDATCRAVNPEKSLLPAFLPDQIVTATLVMLSATSEINIILYTSYFELLFLLLTLIPSSLESKA